VAVTEPPGDFDYLWEDLGDTDDFEFDDYDVEPYKPPPAPWYRTTVALLAICAIGGAVIAIVVSAVLLFSRTSRGPTHDTDPTAPATPSSAPAKTRPPMIATVPAPPPTESLPSESPSESEPTASAPIVVAPPPTHEATPTAPPRINVTRAPMSVSPEPHRAFPHY
jgi:hypothetical protein